MLNVDKFFYEALRTNADVIEVVDGNIYNPARTIEQEEEDVVPYIIITYENGTSQYATKDDKFSPLDAATVSVLVCADSRDALADITETVMDAIQDAFEDDDDIYDEHDDWPFYITSCTPSAGPVEYDALKPCCFQTLTFVCDTEIR